MAAACDRWYARAVFIDESTPDPVTVDPGEPAARLWRVRDIIYGVAFALLAIVAIVLLLGITHVAVGLEGERRDVALALATIAIELAIGGWVLYAARARGLHLAQIGFRRPREWWPFWVAWAGAYAIIFGYTIALLALESYGLDVDRLIEGNQIPVELRESLLVATLFAISVVLLAPLCEELFFRGLIFPGLRGFWRLWPALVASGLLFGVFHQSVAVVVPFSLIGMLFAWANEESGSLWTSIGAHAVVNGVSFALTASGAMT